MYSLIPVVLEITTAANDRTSDECRAEQEFSQEAKMQQHLMQMQPMMAAYASNNITTDHIQKDSKMPRLDFQGLRVCGVWSVSGLHRGPCQGARQHNSWPTPWDFNTGQEDGNTALLSYFFFVGLNLILRCTMMIRCLLSCSECSVLMGTSVGGCETWHNSCSHMHAIPPRKYHIIHTLGEETSKTLFK
eukprot:Gb_04723 [translate_table: standard]